jgi:hypothetical protein
MSSFKNLVPREGDEKGGSKVMGISLDRLIKDRNTAASNKSRPASLLLFL